MKTEKITLHLNIDRKVLDKYQQIYPRSTRTRLVENLFRIVVDNKEMFDRIFFMNLLDGTLINC